MHFFGPDGSGKSSQVNLLLQRYLNRNVKARKYWIRSPHTLAYLLWEVALKVGFFRTISNKSGSYIKVPCVNRSWLMGRLWALVEWVSVLPFVVRADLYLLCGYTLIAERYLIDTLTFVAFSIDDPKFAQSPLAKLYLALIPKKTRFIFIDADYQTIYKRKSIFVNLTNPQDASNMAVGTSIKSELEPQAFIDFQRAIYQSIAKTTHALTINTAENSMQQTSRLIQQHLGLTE